MITPQTLELCFNPCALFLGFVRARDLLLQVLLPFVRALLRFVRAFDNFKRSQSSVEERARTEGNFAETKSSWTSYSFV
jgi:hypothetical protein